MPPTAAFGIALCCGFYFLNQCKTVTSINNQAHAKEAGAYNGFKSDEGKHG
jgi:hypothetical protein